MAEEVKEKKTEVKENRPRSPRATTSKKPAPKAEKIERTEKLDVKPVRRAKGKKQTATSYIATGRRKDAIARVRLVSGNGKVTINNRDIDEYLKLDTLKLVIRQPLVLTGTDKKYDVIANVKGGGYTGQTGAIRHGIARALVKENEMYKAELKKAGFLSRDSRMKERKKYGLHKARKAPQFSKR